MVVLVPVPVVVVPPGIRASVHVPVAGRSCKTTLPDGISQEGWVMVPTVGVMGVTGCGSMTKFAEAGEVHPSELVTVK
jgi:hypothetical protein